jgi:hypothetical protein
MLMSFERSSQNPTQSNQIELEKKSLLVVMALGDIPVFGFDMDNGLLTDSTNAHCSLATTDAASGDAFGDGLAPTLL